jgi:hypothetical protein
MSNKQNKMTLDEFFLGKTVTPLERAADFDEGKDSFLFVGANWCGHSQLGAAHFSEACRDPQEVESPRTCYGIDLAKEGGRQLAKELGVPSSRGVPVAFKWNAEEGLWENIVTGRKLAGEYDELFREKEGL